MSKLLNQDEIDFLLGGQEGVGEGGAGGPDGAKRPVTPYNFKRPRLFSQDQTRVLQHVHELFARDVSVYLSSQLRTMVEVSLTAVDQVLYSEYVASSASPSALYVGEAEELGHRFIFELDPNFVVYTVEKLFGGAGRFLERPREVSQIEQRIMSRVIRGAFDELERAWRQAHELRLREVAFESTADFVQISPSMEPAIVGAFELRVQGHRSFVNVCYPYLLLERILGRTGMQRWASGSVTEVAPQVRSRYEDALRDVDVELRAELGRAHLSLHDVAALEEGDVIPLQRRTAEPIQVFINKQEKFRAAAGTAGKQRALRVLQVTAPPDLSDALATADHGR